MKIISILPLYFPRVLYYRTVDGVAATDRQRDCLQRPGSEQAGRSEEQRKKREDHWGLNDPNEEKKGPNEREKSSCWKEKREKRKKKA